MHLNIVNIAQNIINSRENAISFCQEHGIIPVTRECKRCHNFTKFEKYSGIIGVGFCWRCLNVKCKRYRLRVSVRNGTWLEESKMTVEKILLVTYCFSQRMTNKRAIHETSIFGQATSSETICDWFTYCMEVCCQIVAARSGKIGGSGLTVEIDEAKFGKRKYNRGRIVDGTWILGGICRETREAFLVPVFKRDKDTLIPLIISHVEEGSIIMTDCWKSYSSLDEHIFTSDSESFI